MFLWKKERQIIDKIESYRHHIHECRNYFLQAIQKFISQETFDPLEELIQNVHVHESKADDIRRDIEQMLYNKALVPESREDILYILESMDALPNSFEDLCFQISLQRIEFPKQLKSELLLLVDKNIITAEKITATFIDFFYRKNILPVVTEIDNSESEIDKIERTLIRKIFMMDIEKTEKLILSGIVGKISSISDIAQTIGDRLVIAVTKRRF
ncbi:MAG: DUF47 family protein [Spirochaetales bacterium]|nr:DUF47 family protein [Spirochaetales bacterium]